MCRPLHRLLRPAYKINHLTIGVSIYEGHSNKHRPISNDRAEMEASEIFKGANKVNNSR